MKSAERTVAVLEHLARADRPIPTMALARACGIPRSSTYHLLNLLERHAFVAYEEATRGWTLGSGARDMATGVSLAGAIEVLKAFDAGTPRLAPDEISRRTGIRQLQLRDVVEELLQARLLVRADDGRLTLGVLLSALAARVAPVERLRLVAWPFLQELRDQTGETANLLVAEQGDAVYLEQAESRFALRHVGWSGRAITLSDSATGRALDGEPGVHVVTDAVEAGVTAIACALDLPAPLTAAISVTAPTARMGARRVRTCRDAVAHSAAQVAVAFGDDGTASA